MPGKTRGHGIVIINIHKLTFAIPLRTSIKHNAAYITQKTNQKGSKGKGLDYSKALLITNPKYVSDEIFLIPAEQHKKIQGKECFITNKFEKYVEKYIKAVKTSDKHVLNSLEYRFTTLQNYHNQLGI
ncbi:type III toxin-antitoxin system TenpIN family toxin [Xenorhabdus doucetiae]|uniref:type III toxin-antitoxin system TenpIN family toxin n=1 Tax=Xenorhabdus doucetiae TaxID=351671 RepID=UPI0038CD9AE4